MFFTDTAHIKHYQVVAAQFNFANMKGHLLTIDRTILRKFLGKEFLADLQEKFNKSIPLDKAELPEKLDTKTEQLVDILRICTSALALLKWIPTGQVIIDSSGIRISSTDTVKPAFQWQVKELKDSLLQTGTAALEDALEYLEQNVDDFETYKESDEFKSNRELFVGSSAEMVKHYSSMLNGRVNYYLLKSTFKKVEDFDIKAVLLPNYFSLLKNKIREGTVLNSFEKILIDLIRPAVVNLGVARSISEMSARISPEGYLIFDNTGGRESLDTKKQAPASALDKMQTAAQTDGRTYLSQIRDYLEANKNEFTVYANDPTYPTVVTASNDPNNSFYSAL